MLSLCVIGRGKMGQAIAERASDHLHVNLISHEQAKESNAFGDADVIVCTAPGAQIPGLMDALSRTTKPVIIASTGHDWSPNLDEVLQENRQLWVTGQNFSQGMQSFRHGVMKMLHALESAHIAYEISIHEIHDVTKLDSPSGTAKLLQQWTKATKITSARIARAMPEHVITITLDGEKFEMRHVVDTRASYAQGILVLAQHLHDGHYRKCGLHSFERVFDSIFNLQQNSERRYVLS